MIFTIIFVLFIKERIHQLQVNMHTNKIRTIVLIQDKYNAKEF
jgi:hypothetical protein